MEDHYDLTVGQIQLRLPIIHTQDINFYSFNMMGEAALNRACAQELYNKTKDCIPDVLLTAEAKAIGLTEKLAELYNHSRSFGAINQTMDVRYNFVINRIIFCFD